MFLKEILSVRRGTEHRISHLFLLAILQKNFLHVYGVCIGSSFIHRTQNVLTFSNFHNFHPFPLFVSREGLGIRYQTSTLR
jgi:hypothetical protein